LEEELYDAHAETLTNERNYELNSRRVYYPQTYKRIGVAVQRAEDGSFNAGADTKRLPDAYGIVATAEEEEPVSDCSDCVSQEAFNELYAMVMQNAETIESLEAELAELEGLEETVSGVDSAMTEMATCMAGLLDDGDDEEPVEPETTMMEPETTMMTEPATTAAPSKSPSAGPFFSMTDMVDVVCANDDTRSFKNNFDSAEECADRCLAIDGCMYFSYLDDGTCIGCDVAPTSSSRHTVGYVTYMMNTRRRLSELEMLRAENAALKEMLAKTRRN